MNRRRLLSLSVPAIGLLTVPSRTMGAGKSLRDFYAARQRFIALPGRKSLVITVVEHKSVTWQNSFNSSAPLFVGSAIKTFILATYLRQVEAGTLTEQELLAVDDNVRSLSSPVFGSNLNESENLGGSTSARTVLEAMISHSDNTATDAALLRVGADNVRTFIASAGLTSTLIPDSTRRLLSYIAGAPPGVDIGWAGVKQIIQGHLFGEPRSPINNQETMISTADELVSYYRDALLGRFFAQAKTLTEFKRIQSMADVISLVVPPGIAAYAKGGSIDWQEFHCLAAPGQMIVGEASVTFSFTVNWTGPDSTVPGVSAQLVESVSGMLAAVAQHVSRMAARGGQDEQE